MVRLTNNNFLPPSGSKNSLLAAPYPSLADRLKRAETFAQKHAAAKEPS